MFPHAAILLHGFEGYRWSWPSRLLQDAGAAVQQAIPATKLFLAWLVEAGGVGLVGLAVGLLAIPGMSRAPLTVLAGCEGAGLFVDAALDIAR